MTHAKTQNAAVGERNLDSTDIQRQLPESRQLRLTQATLEALERQVHGEQRQLFRSRENKSIPSVRRALCERICLG